MRSERVLNIIKSASGSRALAWYNTYGKGAIPMLSGSPSQGLGFNATTAALMQMFMNRNKQFKTQDLPDVTPTSTVGSKPLSKGPLNQQF